MPSEQYETLTGPQMCAQHLSRLDLFWLDYSLWKSCGSLWCQNLCKAWSAVRRMQAFLLFDWNHNQVVLSATLHSRCLAMDLLVQCLTRTMLKWTWLCSVWLELWTCLCSVWLELCWNGSAPLLEHWIALEKEWVTIIPCGATDKRFSRFQDSRVKKWYLWKNLLFNGYNVGKHQKWYHFRKCHVYQVKTMIYNIHIFGVEVNQHMKVL